MLLYLILLTLGFEWTELNTKMYFTIQIPPYTCLNDLKNIFDRLK